MTLRDVVDALKLDVLTGGAHLDRAVSGACVSDLLSYVMGSAKTDHLWITIQVHPNVVGVAALLDLSAVVFAHDQQPEEATLQKAQQERIVLLASPKTSYELAGELYALGVR